MSRLGPCGAGRRAGASASVHPASRSGTRRRREEKRRCIGASRRGWRGDEEAPRSESGR